MFYISNIVGSRYSITDTDDGVTEKYTEEQVLSFADKGIPIFGVRESRTIFLPDPHDIHVGILREISKIICGSLQNLLDKDLEKVFKLACEIGYNESIKRYKNFEYIGNKLPFKSLNMGSVVNRAFIDLFKDIYHVLLVSRIERCEGDTLFIKGFGGLKVEESKKCFYDAKVASVDFQYRIKGVKGTSHLVIQAYKVGVVPYIMIFENEENINRFNN